MLDPELKSKITKLWNAFWAGGISNPLSAIEQISYLIFMKRLDDLDTHHINAAQARGQPYKSVFEGHENCRWSTWKHMSAEAMYKHVIDTVFPFIKSLHNGEDVVYSVAMKDAMFIIPKPSLLQEAVALLDEINIGERPDIQGDVYEHLLGELKTAGKNGQFRTPRHIIRMMVELVDPDIGQKICDPACGTGGFLIAAYQHILRKYTTPDMVKIDEDGTPHNLIGDKIVKKEHWELLWNETFYGFDFEITMIRITLMNMILHGIINPNIKQIDTLSKRFDQKPRYDVIFANPPFAGYVDRSDINDNFKLDTTKTELLFLELFYNLLGIGGKAAVIVPNGVLFDSSNAHKRIRKMLLEQCDLQAVVSMPSGVFQPYAGMGTAMLLFVKGGKTEKVWFYEMKSDGYSLDQKRDFIDGKGDIPDIVKRFKEDRSESPQSRVVSIEEIKKNEYSLSFSIYKRLGSYITEYEEPEILIQQISVLQERISKKLNDLRVTAWMKSTDSQGWNLKTLGEVVVNKPQYGLTAKSSTEEDDLIYLRISDITDYGELKNGDFHYISTGAKADKYRLHEGDFLIARSGSVGRVYLHKDLGKPSVFASYLIRFQLDPNKVLPKFVFYWGLSPIFKREIETRKKVGAQPNINAREFCMFRLPVPPLEEQQRIVSALDTIHSLTRDQKESVESSDEFYNAMISKIFLEGLSPRNENNLLSGGE